MEIIVDTADKGGAIIVYPPELAEKKITEKVTNKKLYVKMNNDPSDQIYDKLIDVWKTGKAKKYVTEDEASKVVGLTNNNQKSTASIYKPGETYFNPSLKIHKMNVNDIKPGCDPPARLITCLQDGVTSRSDIFIADKWLKPLQKDFCLDIVEDSIDILKRLNDLDKMPREMKKNFKPFTFDFAALYDSLTPALVEEAVRNAIRQCRPQWNNEFTEWLLSLINLSMSAGFGKFKGKWYKPATGIPTGGNISVQLANIAVYYALFRCLFSKPEMMKNIIDTIRFIDDGSGIFNGTLEQFNLWKNALTQSLKQYGLIIKNEDWDVAANLGETVHILDILYGFDENGDLTTDLYRKETDSRAFLHYSSCHPNHVFSGIVYSQAVRLKRIISKNEVFLKRLDELKEDFKASKYPARLIENIFEKVKDVPRTFEKKVRTREMRSNVILTSTYGRDKKLKNIIEEKCRGFNIPIQFVSKTGATLKNLVSNLKSVSLGKRYGLSKPCAKTLCKSCPLMSGKDVIISAKNKTFRTSMGTCKTNNCIYAATCKLCNKPYVGKSTQPEHKRINGHRSDMKKYANNPQIVNNADGDTNDRYSLAVHLHQEHNIVSVSGLDDYYTFTILEKCTPKSIDIREHFWIQKMKSLSPFGLNLNSPLGFPILM